MNSNSNGIKPAPGSEPLYRAALNIWSSRKKMPVIYDSGTIQTHNGTEFTSQVRF